MGKPPISPYPPDLAEDAVPATELDDLVDAIVVDRDWASRPGLRGVEALRGACMPWSDVLENGPLFAAALGLDIID